MGRTKTMNTQVKIFGVHHNCCYIGYIDSKIVIEMIPGAQL